jgi:hypothetical protein
MKLADLLPLVVGVVLVLALGSYLGAEALDMLNGARP